MRKMVSFLLLFCLFFPSIVLAETHVGGHIYSDMTWTLSGSPYIVDSTIYFGRNGTPTLLTIESGVQVRFQPSTAIVFGFTSGGWICHGLLDAKGTETQHIIFTSNSDPPEYWSGVNLTEIPGDTLEYVDVSYSYVSNWYGTHYMNHCSVQQSSSSGIISTSGIWYIGNSTIQNNNGDGINTSAYNLNITGCSILNNTGYGINWNSGGVSGSITGNTISNNGSYPLKFWISSLPSLQLDQNIYVNNGINKIELLGGMSRGSIYQSATLPNEGIPYVVDSSLYIGTDPVVNFYVEPGVEVQFSPGAGMVFGFRINNWGHWGRIIAKGTPEQHIVFTSNSDPPQSWNGVQLTERDGDTLEYVDISYGYVSNWYGTHYMNHCSVRQSSSSGIISTGGIWYIGNSLIANNTGDGIYGYGNIIVGGDSLNYCDLYGNGNYNINNTGGTQISAEYNFWGTTDPDQIVAKIYGNVDYNPWSDEPKFPDLWNSPTLVSPANHSTVPENPAFVWFPVHDATYYQIVLALDNALSQVVWSKTLFQETSTGYDGSYILENYKPYYWSVRAFIGNEWKNYASPFVFTKYPGSQQLTAPSLRAPTNGSEIDLPEIFSWFDVQGAQRYQLEIASDQQFNNKLWDGMTNVASLQVPGNISGIVDGVTYYWKVRGIDNGGNPGYYSAPNSFTKVASIAAPATPTLIEPQNNTTVTSQTIVFSWNQPPGATSYTLQYSIAPNFPNSSNQTWTIEGITSNSYTITLPEANTTIYWHVLASNSAGSSIYSGVYQFQYNYSSTPEIKSVVIDRPQTGIQVAKGSELTAHANFVGNYDGEVLGEWLVNRQFTQPINFTMNHAQGYQLDSPLLPTNDVGVDTIQVYIYSPNTIFSNNVIYQVYEKQIGPPAKLFLEADPCIIAANGTSTSTISALVQDANGNLIVNDNGREVTFSVNGQGTLPDPPISSTANGIAIIILTSTTTSDDHITVQGSTDGLSSGAVNIISSVNDLTGYLKLFDAYVERLKHLKLEIYSFPFNSDVKKPYNQSQAEEFVNSQIRPGNPSPETLESFERLILAEKVLNLSYHWEPNPAFPEENQKHIDGALQIWGDVVRNTATLVFTAATFIVTVFTGIEGGGLIAEALKVVKEFVLDFIDDVWSRIASLIPSKPVSDIIIWIKDTLMGLFMAYVSGNPTDIFEGLTTPIIIHDGTNNAISKDVEISQKYLDIAVDWAENNQYQGNFETAKNRVITNIEGTRILTQTAHNDILSYEERSSALEIAQEAVNFRGNILQTGWHNLEVAWDFVAHAFRLDDYYYSIKAITEGSDVAHQVSENVREGIFSAYGQPVSLNVKPVALHIEEASTSGLRSASSPNPAIYKQFLTSLEYQTVSFEDAARQIILGLQNSDSVMVLQSLEDLIEYDDSVNVGFKLAMAPIGASAQQALLTIPGFESIYDSVFTLSSDAMLQRVSLILGTFTALSNFGDPVLRQQAIDQAFLSISANNSAYQKVAQTVSLLFTTPAYPLVMVVKCVHPDSVKSNSIFAISGELMNAGSGLASNVALKIYPDSGLNVVGADSVFVGDMNAGQKESFTFQIQAPPYIDSSYVGGELITILPICDSAITYSSNIIQAVYYYFYHGDANGDGVIDIADVVYLINYLFIHGPTPVPLAAGDATCDGVVDVSDVVYLLNYLFAHGPAPSC